MIVESFLNPRREFLESPADGRTKNGGVSLGMLWGAGDYNIDHDLEEWNNNGDTIRTIP